MEFQAEALTPAEVNAQMDAALKQAEARLLDLRMNAALFHGTQEGKQFVAEATEHARRIGRLKQWIAENRPEAPEADETDEAGDPAAEE